ncbi:hypothetical protein THRCLA_05870 [Thraustotheca clavata]|uniref:L-seryl-tRNA(Sec) kinase n=1 Tax=Thraustotheca clavata TaxID=74557 RepID=A0A1V9ZRY3_9STRA|nr:hypothetical protein THRCLA_05870 [Thraustotheca clavata]
MSTNAIIVLLCGLPGAGKSTLSKYILQAFSSSYDIDYLCFDTIFANTSKDSTEFVPEQWQSSISSIYLHVQQSLQEHIQSTTLTKKIFLLDDNMYYRSMRKKYYQLCRQWNAGFCQIYVNTNSVICQTHNASRVFPVPQVVFNRMETLFQAPNPTLCTWETHTLEIDHVENSSQITFHMETLFEKAFKNPILDHSQSLKNERETSRRSNEKSVLHQADLALRQLVGQLLKDAKQTGSNNLPSFAKHLHAKKEALLQHYRLHLSHLSNHLEMEEHIARLMKGTTIVKDEMEKKWMVDEVLNDVNASASTQEIKHLIEVASGLTHKVLRFRLTLLDGTTFFLSIGTSSTIATLLKNIHNAIFQSSRHAISWNSVLREYQLHCNGVALVAPKNEVKLVSYTNVSTQSINQLTFVRHIRRRKKRTS